MRKTRHGLSLVLILVLVLVLSIGLFACNPAQPNDGTPTDQTDNDLPGGSKVTVDAPVAQPLAYNVSGSDEGNLLNCDEYIFFDITSSYDITASNVGEFAKVTDRDGANVALKVRYYDMDGNGVNDTYILEKAEGTYKQGATYVIELLNEETFFVNRAASLRAINFTIAKEYTNRQNYAEDVILIPTYTVREEGTPVDATPGAEIFRARLSLLPGYDGVNNAAAADEKYAVGKKFVIANSSEEVNKNSIFGKITKTYPSFTEGSIIVQFEYMAPSIDEIYEILEIFAVDEYDCSNVAIDEGAEEALTQSILNSQMFYDFAGAVYLLSAEAGSAGIKDTVTGFLDNFKVAANIGHADRGFKLAFSIEYLSDVDTAGKCMYAKIAYGGLITYDILANSELDGTNFYYDYALIINTDHTLTISVQWLDDENDTLVTNDEELAAKIGAILADRTVINGQIFGDAKAVSKEFGVDLIKGLEYIIPNTPITLNLDLKWFLSFGIQAELYNETNIKSTDTVGVRSVNVGGKLVPVPYHTRTSSITNDTMLFGTLTIKTGINVDGFFSIVGFRKWLRIGLDVRAGVYLELDGVYAKTASSDDNIKTAAGEFGWFASVAVEYKVFILSGNIAGVEIHGSFLTFGQEIVTLGWRDKIGDLNFTKPVNPIIGTNLLWLTEIDLPAFESDKKYLIGNSKVDVEANWVPSAKLYSPDDFDYEFGDSRVSYVNGCFLVLSSEDLVTTVKMTLKKDSGISKIIKIIYDGPDAPVNTGATYTLSFNTNGGAAVAPMQVKQLDVVDLSGISAGSKENYSFAGWQFEGVDVGYSFTYTPDYNVTLVAKWVPSMDGYTYISTVAQLKAIAGDLDGKYFLENDINLGGAEWTPIGTAENPFVGVFDGNGKKIYGFKVTKGTEFAGLFGKVATTDMNFGEKSIVDLTIANATIAFTSEKINVYAGVLAGFVDSNVVIENITIEASSVAVTAKGGIVPPTFNAYAGGFVGYNKGTVSGSTTAAVSALSNNAYMNVYAGGFAAVNEGNIKDASAKGQVAAKLTNSVNFGKSYVAAFVAINKASGAIRTSRIYGTYTFAGAENQGGLVAINEGLINDCVVGGSFTFSTDNVGGIAGVNKGVYLAGKGVQNCSFNGTVKGNKAVGGIVGKNEGTIMSCTAIGTVLGETKVGGIVGTNSGDNADFSMGNAADVTAKATNAGFIGIGKGTAGQICGD